MRFDVEKLTQDADPLLVAEQIGMETQQRGSRTSILCPSHMDTKHGNCLITETGYHCFACGATGNVFNMVKEFLNVDFPTACSIIADICGGEEYYAESGKSGKPTVKMLTAEECKLIGLHNNPVCILAATTDDPLEYEKENFKVEIDIDTAEDPVQRYLVYSMDRNPLLDLCRNDPEAYYELIRNRCENALQTYQHMLNYVMLAENCEDDYYAEVMRRIQRVVGVNEATVFIQRIIADILAIANKYLKDYSTPVETVAVIAQSNIDRLVGAANSAFLASSAPF